MKQCSIKNCDGVSWAKGMCRNHYSKQRRESQRVPELKNVKQSKASKEMWRKIREAQREQ